MDNDILNKTIRAGIRAPSGDNCQPWRFKLTNANQIEITIDPDAAKSFFDFNHTGTLFSLGCVIENMNLQCAHEGYSLITDLSLLEFESPKLSVEIQPNQRKSVNLDLIDAMNDRTVNRRLYQTRKIDSETKDYILQDQNLAFSESFEQNKISTFWFDARQDISRWAKLIYWADRIRYSHPTIHEEVFGKILLTKKEAEEKRIGLEIDRLGIGPAAKFVVMCLKPWARMKKLSQIGLDKLLSTQSRVTALMSGAIVVVTIPKNTPQNWFEAGRQTQKLWIFCQQRKLCMQPMTVSFFLNLRYKNEGMQNFLPEHELILQHINTELAELLPNCEGVMLFRLGYGPLMKVPAIRRDVADFIKAN